MQTADTRSAPKKEYSYLIYIFFCVGTPLLARLAPFGRITESSVDAGTFAFNLTLIFVFCSLAWLAGTRYKLRYPMRCALGGAAFIMPTTIRSIGQAPSFNMLISVPLFEILGAFIIGALLLMVSYPFQFLFSKLRRVFGFGG